jgi:hypothetical protein
LIYDQKGCIIKDAATCSTLSYNGGGGDDDDDGDGGGIYLLGIL